MPAELAETHPSGHTAGIVDSGGSDWQVRRDPDGGRRVRAGARRLCRRRSGRTESVLQEAHDIGRQPLVATLRTARGVGRPAVALGPSSPVTVSGSPPELHRLRRPSSVIDASSDTDSCRPSVTVRRRRSGHRAAGRRRRSPTCSDRGQVWFARSYPGRQVWAMCTLYPVGSTTRCPPSYRRCRRLRTSFVGAESGRVGEVRFATAGGPLTLSGGELASGRPERVVGRLRMHAAALVCARGDGPGQTVDQTDVPAGKTCRAAVYRSALYR